LKTSLDEYTLFTFTFLKSHMTKCKPEMTLNLTVTYVICFILQILQTSVQAALSLTRSYYALLKGRYALVFKLLRILEVTGLTQVHRVF